MSNSTPAGWHVNPDNQSQWRYWDGNAWSEHTAPALSAPRAAQRSDVMMWLSGNAESPGTPNWASVDARVGGVLTSKLVGGVVGVCLILGLLLVVVALVALPPRSSSASSPHTGSSPAAPPSAPKPTAPAAPNDIIAASVADAIGDGRIAEINYYPDSLFVSIEWKLADGFTPGLVRAGGELDAAKILEALQDSGVPWKSTTLRGTFEAQDKFGAPLGQQEAIEADYNKNVVAKMVFENLTHDDVRGLAERWTEAPWFRNS